MLGASCGCPKSLKNTPNKRISTRSGRRPTTSPRIPRALKGGKLNVQPDPTATTRIPWNQLTVVLNGFEPESVLTVAGLHAAVQAQLGLTPTNFELRVQQVRAWGPVLPADDAPTIIAVGDTIDDEDNGQFEPLAVIQDNGTVSRRAAVGYEWPLAMRGNVIVSSATNNVKLMEFTNVKLAYVNVYWKPRFAGSRSAALAQDWRPSA